MQAYLRRAGLSVAAVDYAADHLHVSYLCRRAEAVPAALPSERSVTAFFDEVRFVQNAPRRTS
jgi:hypothetical protein